MAPRVLLLCLALAAGCGSRPADDDASAAIAIDRPRIAIRTGKVGMGQWEREASYALVNASNPTDRDRLVTLRGALVEGAARHELRPESLRIPAGGERTFALVDAAQAARPGASAVDVVVSGALAVDYAPPVVVSDGNVYQDQGRAVVAARVTNSGKTEVTTSIVAAFYDAGGRPMERPFTTLTLAGGGGRAIQLVGPPGSTTAQLYVAEVSY